MFNFKENLNCLNSNLSLLLNRLKIFCLFKSFYINNPRLIHKKNYKNNKIK